MAIVYLDQNKWIELAQAECGRSSDQAARDALLLLDQGRKMGHIQIPLSITHYMETLNRKNPSSRGRLGDLMWRLSGGTTLRPGPAILRHEIGTALWARFPHRVSVESIEPLDLLGHGMDHARGEPIHRFVVPGEYATLMNDKNKAQFEGMINDWIERSLLGAGPLPSISHADVPDPDLAEVEEMHTQNLLDVRSWLASLPEGELEDALYLLALTDIAQPLAQCLHLAGVTEAEVRALGWQGWREFVDDLPTERVALHVLRHWSRNKTLQIKRNDMYDWMALIPAAAHCDVVVTENLFADLLNRGSVEKRSTVITDLRDLAGLIVAGREV